MPAAQKSSRVRGRLKTAAAALATATAAVTAATACSSGGAFSSDNPANSVHVTTTASPRVTYTASPASISPGVATAVVTGSQTVPDCKTGYLCLGVTSDGGNHYKLFKLYRCGTYTLHNFLGWGEIINHQTGGAVGLLYGSRHNLLSRAADHTHAGVNFTPVYYVRPC